MQNTSRSKPILIAGAATIVLAVALFVTAMGENLLSHRSKVFLIAAFLLLLALATVLLFILMRMSGAQSDAEGQSHGRGTRRDKSAPSDEPPSAYGHGGILSETADELRSSVDALQEELEDIIEEEAPAGKERMHVLYEETDRLQKIIAGMEQLSQSQEIARSRQKETLQIEPLLAGIIEETRAALAAKDITYSVECEPGLALFMHRESLARILRNIVDNAARFIPASGSVTVNAFRRGGTVVFTVQDTGTGIRRAHLPHIYEHFFRGAGTGIGMGLSIAKELVDACNGTIEVRTAVGEGTTFTVELPAA
jgi:signal transduction histidine kinase